MIKSTPWQHVNTFDEKITWFNKNQHICIRPFQTLQIEVSSENKLIARPCCNYAIAEELVADLAQQFIAVKNDIRDGKKNSLCNTCWTAEQTNNYSERIRGIVPWPLEGLQSRLEIFLQEKNNLDEFNIGIKFSNFCNLACRSCNIYVSSTFASITGNNNIPIGIADDISTDPVKWLQLTNLIDQVLETYQYVNIGLIGGETMIQPGAVKFVEYLVSQGVCNRISLGLTSNFTSLNCQLITHFNKFKKVHLTASVDSTEKNYHYVRWPAQFSKIQKNLDQLRELQKQNSNIELSIAAVFALNNIFYINEYLDFLKKELENNTKTQAHALFLTNPEVLAIENLPVQYRPELAKYIARALTHPVLNLDNCAGIKLLLQGIATFLATDQIVHNLFDNFLKFTANFDQRTDCYLKDFNQRLYEILNDTDIKIYENYLK
jgi:hypothetical protein